MDYASENERATGQDFPAGEAEEGDASDCQHDRYVSWDPNRGRLRCLNCKEFLEIPELQEALARKLLRPAVRLTPRHPWEIAQGVRLVVDEHDRELVNLKGAA